MSDSTPQQQQQQNIKSTNGTAATTTTTTTTAATTSKPGPACKHCRASHRKCDKELPCSQCVKRGLDCEYEPRKRKRKTMKSNTATANSVNNNTSTTTGASSVNIDLNRSTSPPDDADDDDFIQHPAKRGKMTPVMTLGNNNNIGSSNKNNNGNPLIFSNDHLIQLLSMPHHQQPQQQQQHLHSNQNMNYSSNSNLNIDAHSMNSSSNSTSAATTPTTPTTSSGNNNNDNNIIWVNQILNSCFSWFNADDRIGVEFRHSLAMRVLNSPLPSNAHLMSLSNIDQLDRKASQALWCSIHAAMLQQMPSIEQYPYVDRTQELVLWRKQTQIILNSIGIPASDSNEEQMLQMACKFPRKQLLDTSRGLYSIAKSIILDPSVFPYVGSYMKLAQSCALMALYHITYRGEFSFEAEIFLKSVKIFTKQANAKHEKLASISNNTDQQNEKDRLQKLMISQIDMKSHMWHILTIKKTKKSLQKFIQLTTRNISGSLDSHPEITQSLIRQVEELKKMDAALSEGDDEFVQLRKYIRICQEAKNSTSHCNHVLILAIWKLFIHSLEVLGWEALSNTCRNSLHFPNPAFDAEQVNLANEISEVFVGNMPIILIAGARILSSLEFLVKIHIEHAARLTSRYTQPNMAHDTRELEQMLVLLQNDIIVLDALDSKFSIQKCREMITEIKTQQYRQSNLLAHLQSQARQNRSRTMIELPPVTEHLTRETESSHNLVTERNDDLGFVVQQQDKVAHNLPLFDYTQEETNNQSSIPASFLDLLNW